jgi:MoxR-like ATPase
MGKLESVDSFVPESNKKYYNRKFHGKTDFEIFGIAQQHQKNILLRGPTGGGKTSGCLAYASESKIPYKAINMNGGTTVEEMIGAYTPCDSTESDAPSFTNKEDFLAALPALTSKYEWKDGLIPRFIKYSQEYEKMTIRRHTCDDKSIEYTIINDDDSKLIVFDDEGNIPESEIMEISAPEEENGTITETLIIKAWNKCFLAIEEINFSPVDLMSVWFSVLDARREIVLGEHKGEILKAGPGLMIVATMNPDYIGTNKLNRALVDRFPLKLNVEYDKHIEHAIIRRYGKKWGFKSRDVLFLKEFICKIRDTYKAEEIETNISTRMIEEYIEMWGLFGKDMAKEALINSFDQDDSIKVEQFWKIIESSNETYEISVEDLKELNIEEFEGLTDEDRIKLKLKEDPNAIEPESEDGEITDEQIAQDPSLACPF